MYQKVVTLAKAIHNIKSVYTNKDISIKMIFIGNEFDVLRTTLQETELNLNTTAADEHVPEIEQQIKVVKERVQSTWDSLPFKKLPNGMVS